MTALTPSRPVKILLVDDHAVVREGLRRLLESLQGLHIVGEAGDGEQAVSMAVDSAPDVVMLDISMPRMDGLEAARRLRRLKAACRIIMVSINDDPGHVMESFKAGARGYVVKDAAPEEIELAIAKVQAGGLYCSDAICRSLIVDAKDEAGFRGLLRKAQGLSSLEKKVLERIIEDVAPEALAEELGLSSRKIAAVLDSIYKATGADSPDKLRRLALAHLVGA